MADYKEEKWYTTVQSLLNLAMDEGATQAERDMAQQRADAIILKHKIDVSMMAPGQAKGREVGSTEWTLEMPWEFYENIRSLIGSIMHHCSIRVAMHGSKMVLVGFEEDIEFAQVLWAGVFREFVGNLFPKWDKKLDFDTNVYNMVKGGYKWSKIHEEHKLVDPEGAPAKLSSRYRTGYVRKCAALKEEPGAHTQRHEAFRASYATAFQSTVSRRLWAMRAASEAEVVTDRDRYAVALRSTADQVDSEFYKMYPQFDPDRLREQDLAAQLREVERRSKLTQEQRDAEDAARAKAEDQARKNWDRLQNKRYDQNGWRRGTVVGNNVDLSGGRNHLVPDRNELEGS